MDGRAPPGIICLSNVIPYLARREGSGLVRKWESLGLLRRGGGMREGCVYCAILSPGPFPNNGCLHWCSNSRIRLLSLKGHVAKDHIGDNQYNLKRNSSIIPVLRKPSKRHAWLPSSIAKHLGELIHLGRFNTNLAIWGSTPDPYKGCNFFFFLYLRKKDLSIVTGFGESLKI